MDAALRELLDLILRWVHVIAAIMWIGNSLLFNWLDRTLRPPRDARHGGHGESWLLHSGGFYHVEKSLLDGRELPRPLHWFKWQAYTTWLSGAALLVVVYYASGGALLVEPAGGGVGPRAAVAIGVAALAGGWIAYDLIWRVALRGGPGPRRAAAAVSLVLLVAAAWGLTRVFTGRAAFLHIGAMLGTLMAGNVAMKIMPAQRQLVRAVGGGGAADPALSEAAKTRSIHNNYMTFPVIVLMLSSHFPGLYGHPRNWLILTVLLLAGAGVRHFMNIRFAYPRWAPALAATAAAGIAALYLVAASPGAPDGPGARKIDGAAAPAVAGRPVPFEEVRSVVDRRCTACHAAEPADATFGPAPGGVRFDSPAAIRAHAERIRVRAVETRTMPPGNATRMTDAERELLRRWLEQEGAARR